MGNKYLVLLVDDSDVDLELARTALEEDTSGELSSEFEVTVRTASNGHSALALIEAEGPYAVVVSDMQMPRMLGLELLERIGELSPTTVRIMLTAQSDQPTAVHAVNRGNVFRFLTKPCTPQMLRRAVRAGLEHHQVVVAEQRLLSGTLTGAVGALADLLAIANPEAFGRGSRVRRIVGQICDQMGVPERWMVEVAAVLSQLGGISLPHGLVGRVLRGERVTPAEAKLYIAQYRTAGDLIARIPRLEAVAAIVQGLGETRIPHSVPWGRATLPTAVATDILRVGMEVDRLLLLGGDMQDVLDATAARRDLADSPVLDALGSIGRAGLLKGRATPWTFESDVAS